ncbi:LRR receptor-like serine/threonine-protein kinase EFR [Forsythia ovata]|uniref:LRR receptor-like serine/threonine-protein kinase EFR n=1 Tax=Forsythia ovata TaxID=205694 RepID=A0ABD1WM44_9LAMI
MKVLELKPCTVEGFDECGKLFRIGGLFWKNNSEPSNVLLDEDMVAHVSDFGIAKLFDEGESTAQTKTLAAIGYMAPEYGTEGIVSTSGDVYSLWYDAVGDVYQKEADRRDVW